MNVSLIIPSRGRPEHLTRLLKALSFQRGVIFEVIVVTDLNAATVQGFAPEGCTPRIVPCADANLSKARNLGIAASGAEIIAFCDDDAIPEPNWLTRLTEAFSNSDVNAACGFVRGRNGVSYQWKALGIDQYGNDHNLDVSKPMLKQGVVKTTGTNSAFRKSALVAVGGFDEAYRFFLEDADINMRLSKLGGLTAINPRAEVHHAFAPSNLRKFNRVPKSLFEIGASKAHFCNVHGETSHIEQQLSAFRDAQKARLIRFHDLGLLSAKDIRRLLHSLDLGYADGEQRQPVKPLTNSAGLFQAYRSGQSPEAHILTAGFFGADIQRKRAETLASKGHEVVLIQYIYSMRPLKVHFTEGGYWHHKGGVFGRRYRHENRLQLSTRRRRFEEETRRVTKIRTNETN